MIRGRLIMLLLMRRFGWVMFDCQWFGVGVLESWTVMNKKDVQGLDVYSAGVSLLWCISLGVFDFGTEHGLWELLFYLKQ